MKICIVSRFFFPEISPRAFRTTELAIELAQQGHDVLVVLPDLGVDLSFFSREYNITFKYYGKLSWKGFQFGNGVIGSLLQRIQFRILNSAIDFPHTELFFKVKDFLKDKNGFDILISIARPHPIHWGVARAITKNPTLSKTWIADCGDPFTGATVDKFKKWFYLRWIENWAFKKATFITIPIHSSITAYSHRFRNKIRIIPQGFRMDENISTLLRPEKVVPSFAYAGSFIPGLRDPRLFMNFLLKQNIDFRFYVFTNSKEILADYITKSNGRIKLMKILPRDELLQFLKGMDFLVNFDNNTAVHSPSKLIDYAITQLPILNITNKLEEEIIAEFLHGNYHNRYVVENLDQFNIKNVAKQFLELHTKN
ncbi:hypothetical protein L0U88_17235 [Flavihumibacter sp. RY-1]|uniref:Glycosyltransferase subfamily 4-like N-terminal domain-containing protein n=1 Tax=Flavihumibacter fluminis TaxID=2909236 RepID=A0ABS9BMF2_9BACT|nr:hypothetical protein [Flavihumibacter fluminis]MCF1716389.1 hypothetical protein [Flavihumibacter fluminis]